MKIIESTPSLVERVTEAILNEITSGNLPPGSRIIQEQLATNLGVSRQPVQQALSLLHSQGILEEASGRGLLVAHLDPALVRNMYEIRAVLEGLACQRAASNPITHEQRTKGEALLKAGRKAVASHSVRNMIQADMAFHHFIYSLSCNPLIASAMEHHWTNAQRVMGQVLQRDEQPNNVWDQHEIILNAIVAGQARQAEKLIREHIEGAADFLVGRLESSRQSND
jgi:DNA-binding GntR family transcriptional regulator